MNGYKVTIAPTGVVLNWKCPSSGVHFASEKASVSAVAESSWSRVQHVSLLTLEETQGKANMLMANNKTYFMPKTSPINTDRDTSKCPQVDFNKDQVETQNNVLKYQGLVSQSYYQFSAISPNSCG